MPIATPNQQEDDSVHVNGPSSLLTINGLLRSRTKTHPDLKVLGIPNRQLKFTLYSFQEIDTAATLLARHYATAGLPARNVGDTETKLTVAFLAPSGFDYVIHEAALSRLGYCVLFVSINNSAPAVTHLLTAVSASAFIVHPTFATVAAEAVSLLKESHACKVFEHADGETVYGAAARSKARAAAGDAPLAWEWPLTEEEEADLPAFIVHSSGSTGFPKPIVISHRKSLSNFMANFNLEGFTTLPVYHNHGHSCLWRAFCSLKPIFLFPASTMPLTTANVLGLLKQPECRSVRALFGVPYVYKLLVEEPEGLALLKTFELCLYGGSPMPDELGNKLVEEGVKIVGHIGSTEMGQLMTSFRDYENDKGWNWFRTKGPYAVKNIDKFSTFEHRDGDRYEMVVKKGWPTMTLSNREDGGYNTSDAFIKHPTMDGAWKFVGRLDDVLVMLNGEKTTPTPIELTLRGSSTYISDAIVFGHGRSQIGALIVLADGAPEGLSDAEYYELIKPAVHAANAGAPSHSQLSPETLIYLPFSTPIPRADKGSFLRPKVYAAFKDVIVNVYKRLEGEDVDSNNERRRLVNVEEAVQVVTEVVRAAAGRADDARLGPMTDLFDYGLDSLQAGRIRNTLQRDLDLNGAKLSTNIVFDRPSIQRLAEYLVALTSGDVSKLNEPSQTDIMLQLVDKYRNIPVPAGTKPSPATPSLAVIVLTGATGSLGAYILDLLLADPSVERVYCLCRAKDDADASARVAESMRTRQLSKRFPDARVVALASDLADDSLGLNQARYEEIAKNVTMVVHNAWSVNFNLDISSFEPHIRGAINLMRLALSPETAGHFYFSSSVSAVFAWPGPGPVPEAVTEKPEYAQNMGYARSKWVTEKLCEIISEETPLQAGVLRIGQMVGDTTNGIWNETEAISLIFKSAQTIGALPALDDKPSWLPVDYAAQTIVELIARSSSNSASTKKTAPCWHVLMPKNVTWSGVLESFRQAGIKFEAVDRKEWVRRLRESDDDAVKNPTKKLLSFFEGKYEIDDSKFAKRYPLETTKTVEASSALASAPVADDALVAKWVASWRKTGFLV